MNLVETDIFFTLYPSWQCK